MNVEKRLEALESVLVEFLTTNHHQIVGGEAFATDAIERLWGPEKERRGLSAEQQARNLLERMEVPNAQKYSAGELVELANLIANQTAWCLITCPTCNISWALSRKDEQRFREETDWIKRHFRCPDCGLSGQFNERRKV